MGDALSCLDDREEEKQRYDEKPPPRPEPQGVKAGDERGAAPPKAAVAPAAAAAPANGSTRRDASITRSNYRVRSNSRARGGEGDGDEGQDANFAGAEPAVDAPRKREEVSKDKVDRARTLLKAALKAQNVEMIDEAIRKAGKILPQEELEQAQASKRRMSRLQKEAAAERVPASAPNLRDSGKAPAPTLTSKVPKTSAALTAPPAPTTPSTSETVSPGDAAEQAAAIERLEEVVGERRVQELADAIAQAEQAGIGKKEPALRKAREMKEADAKRKEMARLRRIKDREAN